MSNNKKTTRAEAIKSAKHWKDCALGAREVIAHLVNYFNTRTAPVQFIQTKKFVEKCKEAGVQLDVFIGKDPIIGTASTSIIAIDSDIAQGILDVDLDAYGLVDFISEEMVQPWMEKVDDLDDLSSLGVKSE